MRIGLRSGYDRVERSSVASGIRAGSRIDVRFGRTTPVPRRRRPLQRFAGVAAGRFSPAVLVRPERRYLFDGPSRGRFDELVLDVWALAANSLSRKRYAQHSKQGLVRIREVSNFNANL
jgi:hypothetical protein